LFCVFFENLLKEQNTLNYIESQGSYIPSKFGTTIVYKNSLILWGGTSIADKKFIQKIIRLELGKLVFYKELRNPDLTHQDKIYEGKPLSFTNNVRNLFGSEHFADIHFYIEGQKIPAHKLILSFRSKYFANLFASLFFLLIEGKFIFKGQMKESNSSGIEITDVKFKTFIGNFSFLNPKIYSVFAIFVSE